MADPRYLIAIDQGTTSTRAILFNRQAKAVAMAQEPYRQYYPHPGWVEQDPEDIWRGTIAMVRKAIADAGLTAADVAAIGITNQRETTIIWDRATGTPIHKAIVWQDRRTADICAALKASGAEALVRAQTGLLLDPYFSATKIQWLLDHVPDARARAEAGALAFGTVDSFLLWRLTDGAVHATDATNASRTMLFDIHRNAWSADMMDLFGIPASLLPEVVDNSGRHGVTSPALFGAPIMIGGMAGDQQAALIGHGGLTPGSAKATYGTGGFLLINRGDAAPPSAPGILTTIASRIDGTTSYASEGAIFAAGATIRWLSDTLGLVATSADTERLAASLDDNGGVYLVPGFVGLGAPYWAPDTRGLICGLTFDTGPAHIARAALESVAYQTADLIEAMTAGSGKNPATLSVDGGMAANQWLCQFLADVLDIRIARSSSLEATARGAAWLAGIAAGFWRSDARQPWLAEDNSYFEPRLDAETRHRLHSGWREAIERALPRKVME